MYDEYARRPQLDVSFSRDQFIEMAPLGGPKSHFITPLRRIGGEPRAPEAFNNLSGVQDIAQFDPEEFRVGKPVHFMLMVKAPGTVKHKVPSAYMPAVSYRALQTAMDYHAITHGQKAIENSWTKLEFMRIWVDPQNPAHPGNGEFKPVLNHTDEGPSRYRDREGIVSSNYALGTDILTRHLLNPFKEPVTSRNIIAQFDSMRGVQDYTTRPSGRLIAWAGSHPHAAGIHTGDDAVLRTFMWLSYTDGRGEDGELNALARKNPVLRL